MGYIIVTHTDIDGVAGAALYIYKAGLSPSRVLFAEPYNLVDVLKSARAVEEKVVVIDLGVNPPTLNKLVDELRRITMRGAAVEWYDHHVWSHEWISLIKDLGVNLYVDTSTCGTGVVAKYSPRLVEVDEAFLAELTNGVCGADLWKFDHWLSPWLHRLVSRRGESSWRIHVLNTLSKGVLWNNDFASYVSSRIDWELKAYGEFINDVRVVEACNLKIAYIREPRVNSSLAASVILGRSMADIAVVVSSDGKLSFRSESSDVRSLAVKLGGGGHLHASGAKIRIPITVRLKSFFNKEALMDYVHRVVSATMCSEERLFTYST